MTDLGAMIARNAREGRVGWIGVRPARRAEMRAVEAAEIGLAGLAGDRARKGKRAVTLVQAEHLDVIAAFLGLRGVRPGDLRRNIVVSGINLIGLRKREVQVGEAVLLITGPCAPCSRMDEVFGPGGYAAVRGHGGMTAEVIRPGRLEIGDMVRPID
ncbi:MULTISPECIES: MOSC domain-containing protein [unclassified Marinovum]